MLGHALGGLCSSGLSAGLAGLFLRGMPASLAAGVCVGSIAVGAASLLGAVAMPPTCGRRRQVVFWLACAGLGVAFGALVAASPQGSLAVLGLLLMAECLAYAVAGRLDARYAAAWNRGPALALRLTLNAGGAVATCLKLGNPAVTLACAAGLGGGLASICLLMAKLRGASPPDEPLDAAIELYVHSISSLAFIWRLLLGQGAFAARRL